MIMVYFLDSKYYGQLNIQIQNHLLNPMLGAMHCPGMRMGYIHNYNALGKMKMQGPLLKNHDEF